MTPATVTVRWLTTGDGYDPDDPDAREVWLPRLGPTAWLLLEKLHELHELRTVRRDGLSELSVDLEVVAGWFGVQANTVWNAFNRLHRWHHGHLDGTTFTVPARIRHATPKELGRSTRWAPMT